MIRPDRYTGRDEVDPPTRRSTRREQWTVELARMVALVWVVVGALALPFLLLALLLWVRFP